MKGAMKVISTSLLISNVVFMLMACTTKDELDSASRNEASSAVSEWIGSSGGVLSMEDSSAYLSVPVDSIAEESELSLAYADLQMAYEDYGIIPVGKMIRLNPHRTYFDGEKAPRLHVSYNPDILIQYGLSQTNVRMFYWNDEMNDFFELDGDVDPINAMVSSEITHFSYYIPAAINLVEGNTNPVVRFNRIYPEQMIYYPFEIRFKVHDHRNASGNPDNAISNVYCEWSVEHPDGSLSGPFEILQMERNRAINDIYAFTIPEGIVTHENDRLLMTVLAEDNLGFKTVRNKEITGFWRIGEPLQVIPKEFKLTGGFEKEMICKVSTYRSDSTESYWIRLNPKYWELYANDGQNTVLTKGSLGIFSTDTDPTTYFSKEANIFTANLPGVGVCELIFW